MSPERKAGIQAMVMIACSVLFMLLVSKGWMLFR